jgi:hypothetical protein
LNLSKCEPELQQYLGLLKNANNVDALG